MSKSNYSLIWNGFDSNRVGYEMIPFYRTVTEKPLRSSGFFYFMAVVAGVVAREGFSIGIQLLLNLNDTRNRTNDQIITDYPYSAFVLDSY